MWQFLVSTDTLVSVVVVIGAVALCAYAYMSEPVVDDPRFWDDDDDNYF